ncbi:Hypothetical protein NTJ_11442 [Nesidiocoris tenuis]|uniref:Uncharacterized protein n=1 Tax=Nesidiocoris tenuis TaxID=355587 RepID=A0ABN7B4S6_9HEMI|nr:Hypothetical protein NTJ_11442 [Nesidiocoris tenuis]
MQEWRIQGYHYARARNGVLAPCKTQIGALVLCIMERRRYGRTQNGAPALCKNAAWSVGALEERSMERRLRSSSTPVSVLA